MTGLYPETERVESPHEIHGQHQCTRSEKGILNSLMLIKLCDEMIMSLKCRDNILRNSYSND